MFDPSRTASRRGILGSSPLRSSTKYAKKVSKIAHLSDALTLIEEYAATATCVEAQDSYLPPF